MSRIQHTPLACPACGAPHEATLYLSLNARRMPHQIAAILAGRFEVQICEACAHDWQPEHHMLLAWPERRLWVVMMPSSEQPRFAALEPAVLDVLWRAFDAAPAVVEAKLAENEALLAFGHHALTERVLVAVSGLSPGGVESLKGPLVERWDVPPDGALRLVGLDEKTARFAVVGPAVHDVTSAPLRIESLPRAEFDAALTPAALERARARWPALFEKPWCDRARFAAGASASA